MVHDVVEYWGSSSSSQPWGGFAGHDEQRRRQLARHRRLSMTPDAAVASLTMVGQLDVRDALTSVQCPTLVLHRANDTYIDERHSLYAAAHIPGARYVEVQRGGHASDEVEDWAHRIGFGDELGHALGPQELVLGFQTLAAT